MKLGPLEFTPCSTPFKLAEKHGTSSRGILQVCWPKTTVNNESLQSEELVVNTTRRVVEHGVKFILDCLARFQNVLWRTAVSIPDHCQYAWTQGTTGTGNLVFVRAPIRIHCTHMRALLTCTMIVYLSNPMALKAKTAWDVKFIEHFCKKKI